MSRRLASSFSVFATAFALFFWARSAEAAITIDPSYTNVTPGGTTTFHASGGSGDYTWSMAANPSGGHVEAGGVYHAGLFPLVDDKVLVTDSLGETATATVGVTYFETLVVQQPTGTVPPGGSRPIEASGGVPPYAYSYVSNASGGSLATAGTYTAGRRGRVVDVVRITDTVGQVVTAVFSVGPSMTITPGSAKLAPRASVDFDAIGGDGGELVWSIAQNKSGGTIDPATGLYQAGANSHVADIVRAEDSLGNLAEVSISVGGGVA
ncbi:MAG TPA: hypothetical protein VM925_35545, partial [Labilithrix sp.]|nr:hypothetical protein [Labilithrix sp.]